MINEFDITSYEPIDYRGWVFGEGARRGENIKRLGLLNPLQERLWDFAYTPQDQRDDPGQGEMVTIHSNRLPDFLSYDESELDAGEIERIRNLATISAIYHDTGFWGFDVEKWDKKVKAGQTEGVQNVNLRRPHQMISSALFGAGAFQSGLFGYLHGEDFREVAVNIGDHDTRDMPASESGEVFRAADIMWRLSLPHLKRYIKGKSPEKFLELMEDVGLYPESPLYLRDRETQIGKLEIANTIYSAFPDEAEDLLRAKDKTHLTKLPRFQTELRKIANGILVDYPKEAVDLLGVLERDIPEKSTFANRDCQPSFHQYDIVLRDLWSTISGDNRHQDRAKEIADLFDRANTMKRFGYEKELARIKEFYGAIA
jgi:hypothetical protein